MRSIGISRGKDAILARDPARRCLALLRSSTSLRSAQDDTDESSVCKRIFLPSSREDNILPYRGCGMAKSAQTMRLHNPLFEEAFFWYFSFSKEKYETRPPRPPHPSRPILPLLHYPPLPSERPPWGGAWFRWRGARRARSDQRHGEISRWSRKASGDRGRRACRTPR